MIRFIDIRNQGTGSRFSFFNTILNTFIDLNNTHAWDNWDNFKSLAEGFNDIDLPRLRNLCPEWVFDNEEDALEDWIAGDVVSPYEKIQELEDKIETMKRDHALEQLDRNMQEKRS
jgi:hypothetical protein